MYLLRLIDSGGGALSEDLAFPLDFFDAAMALLGYGGMTAFATG